MLGPIRDPIPSLEQVGTFEVLSGESYAHTSGHVAVSLIIGKGRGRGWRKGLTRREFSGKYSEVTVVGVGQIFSRGHNLLVGGVGACVRMISASKAKALL